MKPSEDRHMSMNCEGLGRDRGLAPTKPQYVDTSDLGICEKANTLNTKTFSHKNTL